MKKINILIHYTFQNKTFSLGTFFLWTYKGFKWNEIIMKFVVSATQNDIVYLAINTELYI